MKIKSLYISLFITIAIVVISGIGYYFFVTSAKYSFDKIRVSVNTHDLNTFNKYVDVNEIIIQALSELTEIISIDEIASFFGKEAVQAIEDLEIETVAKMITESVLDFVEKGRFEKDFFTREVISKILGDITVDNIEIAGFGEMRKEGKMFIFPLELYVEPYNGKVIFEFSMRDNGMYWQAMEIINVADAIRQAAGFKKSLPHRNLLWTSLHLARSIEKAPWRSGALQRTAAAHVTAGKTERAHLIFEEAFNTAVSIEDINRQSISLNYLARELVKAGKMEKALETARSIKNPERRLESLKSIAGKFEAAGNMIQANHVLAETLETVRLIQNQYVRTRLLSSIAIALARTGTAEQALDTVKKIEGSIPQARAMISLASNLAKAGKMEHANFVFSEASDTVRSAQNATQKERLVGTLALELVRAGNIEKAIGTAGSIESEQIRDWSLGNVANELARQGSIEQALNIVNLIKSGLTRDHSLSVIAGELAKAGKMEQALDTVWTIQNPYRKQEALTNIAGELVSTGNKKQATQIFKKALSTANKIHDVYSKAIALNNIAGQLAKAEEIKHANLVFKRAVNIAKASTQNLSMRDNTLSSIAIELAKAGNVEQALNVAISINNMFTKDKALQHISIEFIKTENIEEALVAARTIADDRMLMIISNELLQAGRTEWALQAARSIKGLRMRTGALNDIATELVKSKNNKQANLILAEALDAAKKIKADQMQGTWRRKIAINLAKAGNIEQALDVANYIESSTESRLSTFLDIAINLKLMSPPMNTKQEPEVAQKILNLAFSK